MSRANQITLFIILLQAAVGFVDGSGMFSQHYLSVPSNNATYTITDLEQYNVQGGDSEIVDEVGLLAEWAWESFFIGIKIVLVVVFVLPTLINTFNIPLILSVFIQAGIYYIYAAWYAQYKSGKGWSQIREV
jgi:hypothetical protein